MNSAAVALIVVLIIALLLGFPIIWSLAVSYTHLTLPTIA